MSKTAAAAAVKYSTLLGPVEADLNAVLVGRREAIAGTLTAMLAREHVFFFGPPGTAKSALVRAVATVFGGSYFERLLTKATTPDELFGRPTLERMARGDYNIVTTGKLSEAAFAFLDEVFKSNSMSLNAMLALLNERRFITEDGQAITCPLQTAFGASNEMPEGKELEAFFDRFMVRFDVSYLSRRADLKRMLLADEPESTVRLSLADLERAQQAAAKVVVTDETMDALMDLRETLIGEGIQVSDRRLKKSLKLVRASAFMADADETCPEDLLVLKDVLWREPKERTKVARVVGDVADPVSTKVTAALDAAREEAAKVNALRADRSAFVAAAAKVLTTLEKQAFELQELAAKAGRRTKQVALDGATEVVEVRADFLKETQRGMGLGIGIRMAQKAS